MDPRESIVRKYSEWTAFSATRSGCPIKSRDDVYPLIRSPDYDVILRGSPITRVEFDDWHEKNTTSITKAESRLPVGWAAKLINIYLKTRSYVAREGRPRLVECLHPPIDNGLWQRITEQYGHDLALMSRLDEFTRIKNIKTYAQYRSIIETYALSPRNADAS